MLDSTGKLYEKMILNRVQSELDDPENEGLLEMQYGFRAGWSTLQRSPWNRSREASVPWEHDVKNAFNTANW